MNINVLSCTAKLPAISHLTTDPLPYGISRDLEQDKKGRSADRPVRPLKGPQVPAWLKKKVTSIQVPVYFIQAQNDFSIRPSLELSEEMKKAGKPYVLKIYPPYGKEAIDGHEFVYAAQIWGPDVFPRMREWIGTKKAASP